MVRPITHSQDRGQGAGLEVWPPALTVLGVSLGAALLALWRTPAEIVTLWSDSDAYGHGFFIAPIAAYLVWSRRDTLATLTPRPTPMGLLGILAGCLIWLIGQAAGIALLSHFAFVAILQCVVLTIAGWRVVSVLLFPLFYLYLMVPFGDFLVPALQDLTAVAVVNSLRVIGVPVFIEGIYLSIPSGSFEISEACAGLRFMIAVFALGLVYAHLVYRSWRRQIAFMALAMIVTLIANSLRALGIVYLAYVTDFEVAVGADHLVYGWVFLSLVMLALFLLGLTFRDRYPDAMAGEEFEPVQKTTRSRPSTSRLASCALGAVLLVVAASAYAAQIGATAGFGRPLALEAPSAEAPWVRETLVEPDWHPVYLNSSGELLARYRAGGRTADLYLAFYPSQREGAEVVNARNKLADGDRWRRLGDVTVDIEFDGERLASLGTVIQDTGGRKRLVVRWYWVGGQMTASPYGAKWLQVRALLLNRPPSAAAILVSAPLDESIETAIGTVRSLVAALPSLEATLAQAAAPSSTSAAAP